MVVRRAVPAEAEALWNIRNQAIRHGCRADYPPEVLAAWTPERMPGGFPDAVEQNPFFVVDDEAGNPVATGFLDPGMGSVEAVFTLPAFTGRGMARQILNAIKQEARQRGMRTLMLSSTPNARDFYLKQGFSVIKEGTYPSSLAGGTLRCFEMICEL